MEDIKDIHLPVEFPLWGWITIAIILALIITAVVFWLIKRKKPIVPQAPIVPVRSPSEIALAALEDLHHKHYPAAGLFKQFYITLSDIVRRYLEDRFSIKAPEMTTEEFLIYAQSSTLLTDAQKQFLKDFLNGCDMVKFAKHLPTVNEAQANFDLAKKLITETSYGI